MNQDDELTPEEKRALAGLAGGPEPSAGLEDAVVSRLSRQGLIAQSRTRWTRWTRWALAAAAGIALFAAGLALGQRRGAPASEAGPAAGMTRYVLLLYNAPGEATLTDTEMAARVDEYRNWAISLRQSGSDISGEKLASRNLDLGSSAAAAGPEPLGGFFIFSAKDPEVALAIARSCPHLRHGGRAELRPIEET
jgi:hypothetical protein